MAGTYGEIPVTVCDCGAVKMADQGKTSWTKSISARLEAQRMGLFFKGERCCECCGSGELFGGFLGYSLFCLKVA